VIGSSDLRVQAVRHYDDQCDLYPLYPSLTVRVMSAESFLLFVVELFPISCSEAQQKLHLFLSSAPKDTSSVVRQSDRPRRPCSVS